MWLLAAGSVVTVFQRVLAVRNSPGARDLLPLSPTTGDSDSVAGDGGER